jgi:hypothetical protein
MEKEEAIKIWKDHKITQTRFEFYCGGDSMGDTIFHFETENNEELPSKVYDELVGYFDDEVYRNVEFYEASDGHYMGEMGNVYIELNDENDFYYNKSSESEWNETFTSVIGVPITDDEKTFIEKNVRSIVGGFDDNPIINYSRDLIMTDKTEKMIEGLLCKIDSHTQDFVPDFEDKFGNGELQEWYTYDTSDNNNDIINEKGELVIPIDNNVCVYKEE